MDEINKTMKNTEGKNEYRVEYATHSYKSVIIKADSQEDAEYLSKLNAPKGFEPIIVLETTDSVTNRIMNPENK